MDKLTENNNIIPRASSITHEHLLSIIYTESRALLTEETQRILDAGCGNGRLMAYLFENLARLNPSLRFEIYGFDIADHGVQDSNYFAETINLLSTRFPTINWKERLTLLSVNHRWPYPDGYFDVIVSNQVMEHVENHDLFFSEIHRTLRKGGFSVHLFPLEHCIHNRYGGEVNEKQGI